MEEMCVSVNVFGFFCKEDDDDDVVGGFSRQREVTLDGILPPPLPGL